MCYDVSKGYCEFPSVLLQYRGMWWHSKLRHCATGRRVAGLILDGVIGIFH